MGKKRAEGPRANTCSSPEQQQRRQLLTSALAEAIGENETVSGWSMQLRNRICMLEALLAAMQMRQERQEKRKRRVERQLARARAASTDCAGDGE